MQEHITEIENNKFSGAVLVQDNQGIRAEMSYGYANRSEQLENTFSTRFGIAFGCKLFTAIAICQLVEKGALSFDTTLENCLDADFPSFDKDITIHHLLNHTSGVPDYFDEEVMDDFEELWIENPMYRMRSVKDFLPLFQDQPMKFKVGERFHYNNAGYILLGLIIEKASKRSFAEYVQEFVLKKAGMADSGYFELDALPSNTALGYIDYPDGTWKTNSYSLPVKGGPDGGAYVSVGDMAMLWGALLDNRLLSEEYTQLLISPHVAIEGDDYYGYGVWIKKNGSDILKYHVMGYDPGVSFHSAYYPTSSTIVVVCSNQSEGAYEVSQEMEEKIGLLK